MIPTSAYHPSVMLTSTARLFRFLLSLVIRYLRLSAGRIPPTLRSWSASLWSSILTFARRRASQSRIRLHANDVPAAGNTTGHQVGPQISEPAKKVEEEHGRTLAALPVRTAPWDSEDEVARYKALTSSRKLESDPHPATPEGGSQRYKRRTVK